MLAEVCLLFSCNSGYRFNKEWPTLLYWVPVALSAFLGNFKKYRRTSDFWSHEVCSTKWQSYTTPNQDSLKVYEPCFLISQILSQFRFYLFSVFISLSHYHHKPYLHSNQQKDNLSMDYLGPEVAVVILHQICNQILCNNLNVCSIVSI